MVRSTALSIVSSLVAASGALAVSSYPGSNPIAGTYPNDITGRFNETSLIIPAPKAAVEALLPSGYKLLPSHPVPGIPADMWPLGVQVGLDQDVHGGQTLIDPKLIAFDFYNGRVQVPWMDRSGDGKTPFKYIYKGLVSPDIVAALGTIASGEPVVVCDTHPDSPEQGGAFAPLPSARNGMERAEYNATEIVTGKKVLELVYERIPDEEAKYPFSVFESISKQGFATDGPSCIYHPTSYNVTDSKNSFVKATITLSSKFVPSNLAGTYEVQGYRSADAFIEYLNQNCSGEAYVH